MKTLQQLGGYGKAMCFRLLLPVILLMGVSCQLDHEIDQSFEESPSFSNTDLLKIDFSKSLSGALKDNPNLREFIRTEALATVNGDFDVVYAFVKNKPVGGGSTFEQLLAPYFGGVSRLRRLANELPLLTIFVPSLPEDSFSAEKWNTELQIPFVATRVHSTNEVPIFSPDGKEFLLDPELIPSYPVIVVKDNERLVVDSQKGYREANGSRVISVEGTSYRFVDDIFDHELRPRENPRNLRTVDQVDPKLDQAYSIYLSEDGWQRDYIYYDISPSSPNGQFTYDFVESIRYFNFVGDGLAAYRKIAEQTGDPRIKEGKKSSGWTDGYFEIKANVLIQSKNGVGSSISNYFLVSGANLFYVTYTIDRRGIWPFRYDYYIIKSVTPKPQYINIPIVNWDLNSYAASFRIDIEESDNTTTVTETVSDKVKFATNFGLEAATLILKKIGLKFGASLESEVTNTVSRTYTLNSDPIGTVIVNFADKVVLSRCGPCTVRTLEIREYTNDIISISVEPRRVQ